MNDYERRRDNEQAEILDLSRDNAYLKIKKSKKEHKDFGMPLSQLQLIMVVESCNTSEWALRSAGYRL